MIILYCVNPEVPSMDRSAGSENDSLDETRVGLSMRRRLETQERSDRAILSGRRDPFLMGARPLKTSGKADFKNT